MTRTTNLRRHRRSAVVTLFATACLTIAACSSTAAPNEETGTDGGTVAIGNTGPLSDLIDMSDVCGDEPVTVGLVDGFGTNSWSRILRAEVEDEAGKCPAIEGVEYAAGRGDLQATLSAITGMTAKGVDILLVVPSAGPGASHLPALQAAHAAGVVVVPIAADPTGTPGTDYFDYVDWDTRHDGVLWAQWMADRLGAEGGNVVLLGGPAGNAVSQQELEGINEVFATAPQINVLTPEPVTTNWDPAMTQQAMAGLLARYPQIDGVISDYGTATMGAIRAFQSAGRPLVPVATTDDNELSCLFDDAKADNPDFELATVSARTWIGRVGLRKALAQINGLDNQEPSLIQLSLYEDSTGAADGAVTPVDACQPALPPGASPSSQLSADDLAALFEG
ncbi:substrate-binding domain-containing protein [Micromonospora sp. LOL_021]|uniref:substrate-binding domain-containing protein n=1 Tax=Micromonospora sp. LOL_021 TaxID=3345417 RepID=UPI003A836A6F